MVQNHHPHPGGRGHLTPSLLTPWPSSSPPHHVKPPHLALPQQSTVPQVLSCHGPPQSQIFRIQIICLNSTLPLYTSPFSLPNPSWRLVLKCPLATDGINATVLQPPTSQTPDSYMKTRFWLPFPSPLQSPLIPSLFSAPCAAPQKPAPFHKVHYLPPALP
jgi:hypothetical protein